VAVWDKKKEKKKKKKRKKNKSRFPSPLHYTPSRGREDKTAPALISRPRPMGNF
jgi:hypothetical protein